MPVPVPLQHLASEAVNESRANLEDFRNEYEILVAEDKVMDKAFKREFHDVSAVMADQLYRLFRKRPRCVHTRVCVPAHICVCVRACVGACVCVCMLCAYVHV